MSKNKEDLTALNAAFKAIEDKFGKNTVILDISEISGFGDYFIITSGSNPNQVRAIADNAEEELAKTGTRLSHSEGYQSASWILLDFGHIIIHVLDEQSREFYNIERVWGDAPKIVL